MIPKALLLIMRFGGFACVLSFPSGDRFTGRCQSRHSRASCFPLVRIIRCVIPQTCVWGPVHSRLHLVSHRRSKDSLSLSIELTSASGNRQRGATQISRPRSREAAKLGLPTDPAARRPGLCPRHAFLLQPSNSRLQTHLHQVSWALRIRLDHLSPLTSPSLNSYSLLPSSENAPWVSLSLVGNHFRAGL